MNNKAPCGNELLWAEVAICREHGTSCAPGLLNHVEPLGGPGNYLVLPTTYEAAPAPLDGLTVERLAVEIDRHWVFRTDDGIFHCSAGDWEGGPDTKIAEGDRVVPFPMHIARSLAALRDEGETT